MGVGRSWLCPDPLWGFRGGPCSQGAVAVARPGWTRPGVSGGRPGGQSGAPTAAGRLIYDAFSSKQTHFRTPLRDINYPKGLICVAVVGQCLTRKHSCLSAVSIQGELRVFFSLIEHFKKGAENLQWVSFLGKAILAY